VLKIIRSKKADLVAVFAESKSNKWR